MNSDRQLSPAFKPVADIVSHLGIRKGFNVELYHSRLIEKETNGKLEMSDMRRWEENRVGLEQVQLHCGIWHNDALSRGLRDLSLQSV